MVRAWRWTRGRVAPPVLGLLFVSRSRPSRAGLMPRLWRWIFLRRESVLIVCDACEGTIEERSFVAKCAPLDDGQRRFSAEDTPRLAHHRELQGLKPLRASSFLSRLKP